MYTSPLNHWQQLIQINAPNIESVTIHAFPHVHDCYYMEQFSNLYIVLVLVLLLACVSVIHI